MGLSDAEKGHVWCFLESVKFKIFFHIWLQSWWVCPTCRWRRSTMHAHFTHQQNEQTRWDTDWIWTSLLFHRSLLAPLQLCPPLTRHFLLVDCSLAVSLRPLAAVKRATLQEQLMSLHELSGCVCVGERLYKLLWVQKYLHILLMIMGFVS